MTHDTLKAIQARLGWSTGEMARRCGIDHRTMERCLAGTRDLPGPIFDWLIGVDAGLADALARVPPIKRSCAHVQGDGP